MYNMLRYIRHLDTYNKVLNKLSHLTNTTGTSFRISKTSKGFKQRFNSLSTPTFFQSSSLSINNFLN